MGRKRRTRILVLEGGGLARRLANEVRAAAKVEELKAPDEGLVMLKLREGGKRGLFNLGEALVTEALARIGATIGRGIVLGREPALAADLAAIDAAYGARLALVESWEPILAEAEARIEAGEEERRRSIAATKVAFETMDAEAP
jgi:alpha-D-ribose 1-methylphosphonate 5-triphosphate synthase subunit PhnG